ncbi:MAG: hypothetical protein ACOYOP_04485 [Microthrixaceae bacterium]
MAARIWNDLWSRSLSRVFGDGIGADLAGRGSVYLLDEVRRSLRKEDERLTTVRLRPGESYTVIARPPATREERRLAARQRALRAREEHMTRPTRRQLTTARRLERAQRRLDRSRPGSRRHRRAATAEARLGGRFDRLTTPSKRLVRTRADLDSVTARLDRSREVRYEEARGHRRRIPRRRRTRVFE